MNIIVSGLNLVGDEYIQVLDNCFQEGLYTAIVIDSFWSILSAPPASVDTHVTAPNLWQSRENK